jgi:hypothetical protein
MWDLEYLLLFGIPGNKTEILDGRGRWTFPFLERAQGEAHFDTWLRTLCRWKDISHLPAVAKDGLSWKSKFSGIKMELTPRPIDLRIPINMDAFLAIYHTFYRREFWPEQPPERQTGYDHFLDDQDVKINLWKLFRDLSVNHIGHGSSRVAIALSDSAIVEPDAFYFARSRDECMIDGNYFQGTPDLIAEVLTPPSRGHDRGARRELYRRHGVPHLWLLDPPVETIEVYELVGRTYRLTGTYHCGEELRPALFPDESVAVADLFWTQEKQHREHTGEPEEPYTPDPIPEWLIPAEQPIGLEYLFYLGHPEKRWEIWHNRAPNVLVFGSPMEAQARFRHFLEECCRWEQAAVPRTWMSETDAEQVEVGRFRLTRCGRLVSLDVVVDARKYRELLYIWPRREAWDWGEK